MHVISQSSTVPDFELACKLLSCMPPHLLKLDSYNEYCYKAIFKIWEECIIIWLEVSKFQPFDESYCRSFISKASGQFID